jgi:hypothetical protein
MSFAGHSNRRREAYRGRVDARADDPHKALRWRQDLPRERPRRQVVAVPGVDQGLLAWAQPAVEDLARRLGVPVERVTVVALGAVTWSDRSCGCPQPGMRYPQVPVDGAYARLEAGGRSWHYHGGGGRDPFLCEA